MQILVVVAIIQMRTLKAEEENVTNRTALDIGLLGPKILGSPCESVLAHSRKGMRLIFLKLKVGMCGNINHLRNVCMSPWKSFLFFLTNYWPWNWVTQRKG